MLHATAHRFNPSRRDFLATLSALSLLGLIGCSKTYPPLKISSQVWPGFEFMFLARNLGWLDSNEVRLIETTDATDSIQLLSDGLIDGAALTLDEVLRARANGIPLSVVMLFDFSAGADVLLVKPTIRSLTDLRGKRIGVEETALGGLLLAKIMESAGLSVGQIQLVHASVDQHQAYWQKDVVDALITYSPVADKLEQAGAVRLFDSRAIPSSIVDVLAVMPNAKQNHQESLRLLVAANFRALTYLTSDPQDANARMASRLGVEAHQVASLYSGLRMVSLEDNHHLLSPKDSTLKNSARDLSNILLQDRLVNSIDDLHGLFDDAYLPLSLGTVG